MTKFSIDPALTHDRPANAAMAALLLLAQRDGSTCDLYAAGHQMHYRHQGDAVHSPSRIVREAVLDGTRLTMTLDDSTRLCWRHHDPDRLSRILELLSGKGVVYPEFHAFRVGPYWFNCAADADGPLECRVSAARNRPAP
jgi:hypothetical protein